MRDREWCTGHGAGGHSVKLGTIQGNNKRCPACLEVIAQSTEPLEGNARFLAIPLAAQVKPFAVAFCRSDNELHNKCGNEPR